MMLYCIPPIYNSCGQGGSSHPQGKKEKEKKEKNNFEEIFQNELTKIKNDDIINISNKGKEVDYYV